MEATQHYGTMEEDPLKAHRDFVHCESIYLKNEQLFDLSKKNTGAQSGKCPLWFHIR